MENSSLLSDVSNNTTTSLPEDDNGVNARDSAKNVIYAIIGSVGVVSNLFVIVIFIFFIKITNKVNASTYHWAGL